MSDDSEQDDKSVDSGDPQSEWIAPDLDLEMPRIRPFGCSILNVVALLLLAIGSAMFLIPNFVRARAQGSMTPCKSNLKNIGTALEMYSTDWSGKYPASTTMLTPKYLKTTPECPAAASNSYRAYFGSGATFNPKHYEDYYYIECYGENHKPVSVTGNYPAYNSIQGLIERKP